MSENKYIGKSHADLTLEKSFLEEKLELAKERNENDKTIYENMKFEDRVEAEQVWLQSIRISGEKIELYTEEIRLINEVLKTFE